jgi:hypothetical protein
MKSSGISYSLLFIISVLLAESIMISTAISAGYSDGDLTKFFEESGWITSVSYIQLLLLSAFSFAIYFVRTRNDSRRSFAGVHMIWVLIGCGFIYLAFDERFMWHERLDFYVHDFFNIEETSLTDRLDDIIIGISCLIGLVTAYICRKEVFRYSDAKNLLIWGFIFIGGMTVFDIVSNRYDVIPFIFGDDSIGKTLHTAALLLDDSFKLLAEGFFISALFCYMRQCRSDSS